MKKSEKDFLTAESKKKEEKPQKVSAVRRREKRKKEVSAAPERPAFVERKKLFKRRSFRRQYSLFRKGGLGVFDSFFNSLYIVLTEKSIEKETKRLQKDGKEISSHQFLEHHAPLLRAISFFPRKVRKLTSGILSLWKRDGGDRVHQSKLDFVRNHASLCIVLTLALLVTSFVIIQLSKPVVLRAQIDGKVIGIVENKHLVDSAVNELEDNVEIILGESFHFPHEIQYSFARQWKKTLTEKSKITETLYTYVSEYICTAGGLYVDDVLVAVCEDEETIQRGLEDFVNANAREGEAGIFNEIRVITQAYPTESILTYDEFQLLLKEMTVPLEDRKKEPVPGGSILTEIMTPTEEEELVPAMVLVADSSYIPEEKKVSYSNYPQPIDGIKLDLYTSEIQNYETSIPYETLYVESDDHYTSMADITTRGAEGSAQVEARVYYVDGKEVKREIISETVKKAPVNRVISIGTKVLPESLGLSGVGSFIVPRVGYVSYYYGERESGMHYGWDIPGDEGDNVYAAASGKVIVAIGPDGIMINTEKTANHYTGYGYCIVIEHEGGYSTMYAHCSKILVTLGQEVKQGEKIGEVGNTGWSDGNHVHFEIVRSGVKMNPALYLYQGRKTIYD